MDCWTRFFVYFIFFSCHHISPTLCWMPLTHGCWGFGKRSKVSFEKPGLIWGERKKEIIKTWRRGWWVREARRRRNKKTDMMMTVLLLDIIIIGETCIYGSGLSSFVIRWLYVVRRLLILIWFAGGDCKLWWLLCLDGDSIYSICIRTLSLLRSIQSCSKIKHDLPLSKGQTNKARQKRVQRFISISAQPEDTVNHVSPDTDRQLIARTGIRDQGWRIRHHEQQQHGRKRDKELTGGRGGRPDKTTAISVGRVEAHREVPRPRMRLGKCSSAGTSKYTLLLHLV